jgi:hypothetical protein
MARPKPDNPDQKPRDPSIEEDRDQQQDPNERQERNPKRDEGERQKQQREPIEPSENDGEGDSPGGPSSPGTRRPR